MDQVPNTAMLLSLRSVQQKRGLCISICAYIKTKQGLVKALALIDGAAESNFVSKSWAHRNKIRLTARAVMAEAVDGHKIATYGQATLDVTVPDSGDMVGKTSLSYHAVDMTKYDLILGVPWHVAANPDIFWVQREWYYRDETSTAIALKYYRSRNGTIQRWEADPTKPRSPGMPEVISAYEAERELLDGAQAYVIESDTLPTEATSSLAATESKELPEYVKPFVDVFSEEHAAELPSHTERDHAIDIESGKDPPYRALYRLSPKESEVLREYLVTNLAKGWIRESKSPAGAPILFVPKKDGSLRLCVDYRGLNAITIKNRYPLPLIGETIDRLAGARIYTQLDLRDAYHRIRIKDGDEWKTAFRTRYGHYEYTVMPFGLANAPATFQAYVNRALADLLDICCVAYLDDIIIYSQDESSHADDVQRVLERLRQYKLYAKLSKCAFEETEIRFLGFIISPEGVHMEPERVATIRDWPVPRNVREVLQFTGFANFYRRFVEGYSRIAAPLTNMTKGHEWARKGSKADQEANAKFVWTEETQRAFDSLKERFTTAPFLRHFDPELPLRVETDASNFAISGILSQLQRNGHWHPIAYYSRKLTGPEVRYETHDSEMLAIVEAFKHWRHYLEGSAHPVTVWTDHNNLTYFMTTKELNRRQARWAEKLSAFDFNIEHRPGTTNPADAPSRRPDYDTGDEPGITLLPTLREKLRRGLYSNPKSCPQPKSNAKTEAPVHLEKPKDPSHVDKPESPTSRNARRRQKRVAGSPDNLGILTPRSVVLAATQTETAYSDMPEELAALIHRCQQADVLAESMRKRLANPGKKVKREDWSIGSDDLLRYKGAVYVPPDHALRQELLRTNHDDPQGGHFGLERTHEVISSKYYWHGSYLDTQYYIRTCNLCQRMKTYRHKEYGLLKPLPKPSEPFEIVTLDFITDLPLSKWRGETYDSILVIVEPLTKYVIYLAVTKDTTSEDLAEILYETLVKYFTVPKHIVSDRAKIFTSAFWKTFCWHMGTKRKISTAFHPRTDGQTERQNQTLEHFMRTYVNFEQDDWARWIPMAQHVYNNSKHSVTGMTPMEALMGFRGQIRINVEDQPPSENEFDEDPDTDTHRASKRAKNAMERVKAMQEQRAELQGLLQRAAEVQAHYYNRHRMDMQFRIGDWVMLRTVNIVPPGGKKKFDSKQIGPFQVVDTWGTNAYKLALPPKFRKLHNVFHVSLLEPFRDSARNPTPPEGALVDGQLEYKVESIRMVRGPPRNREYYVKWEGYSEDECTWEPLESVNETAAFEVFLQNPLELRDAKRRRKKIIH